MRTSPHTWLDRHGLHLSLVALLALSLALASCAEATAKSSPTTPPSRARVYYDAGASAAHPMPYALVDFTVATPQALAMLANLGVFPYIYCSGWGWGSGVRWNNPAEALGKHEWNHGVQINSTWVYAPQASVAPNAFNGGASSGANGALLTPSELAPAAPTNWVSRLAALPQVDSIENGDLTMNCPMIPLEKPVAGHAYFLAAAATQATPTYLQVTFASSVSYDDAVTAALSQGMRLARPCAEAAHAPWAPLSQETAYASGHTLTLALTIASSTLWQQQLRTLPGVVSFQAPYMPTC